jgi:hypothetical protein
MATASDITTQRLRVTADDSVGFSQDLLRGASEIAEYLFGDGRLRRKVYHLVATSNVPVFKLGSIICARKSILLNWIEDQEMRRWRKHSALNSSSNPFAEQTK